MLNILKLVLQFVLICVSSQTSAKGWVDAATPTTYSGWACDANSPNYQTPVHIWRDDNVFLGGTIAANPRESAVGAACGSSHNYHGFSVEITVPADKLYNKWHLVRPIHNRSDEQCSRTQ